MIHADSVIKAKYYFRVVLESWNEKIIKEIASLGHEVGYHYEDLYRYAARCMWLAENDHLMGAVDELRRTLTV